MDQWKITQKFIEVESDNIRRSYKCINQNRYIRQDTVKKHLDIITSSLENIREVIASTLPKFTTEHKKQALDQYFNLRDLLVKALAHYNINQEVPLNIEEQIKIDTNIIISTRKIEPSLDSIEQEISEDTDTDIIEPKMAQSVVEFINTATRIIPDFDGKPENLKSFQDALSLLETIKGTHEAIALTIIKTKLRGNARNVMENGE